MSDYLLLPKTILRIDKNEDDIEKLFTITNVARTDLNEISENADNALVEEREHAARRDNPHDVRKVRSLQVDNDLVVMKNTFIHNELNVAENVKFLKDLQIQGSTIISGGQTVNGVCKFLNDINAEKNIIVRNDIQVKNNATIDQNLRVKGDSDFTGNLNLRNDISVDGTAIFSNGVNITGDSIIDDNLEITGTLIVSDIVINGKSLAEIISKL